MRATRNGTPAVRDAAQTLHPGVAAHAAAHATRRLIDGIQEFEKAGPPTRFAKLTEVRYWADVVTALTGYVAMFERNP